MANKFIANEYVERISDGAVGQVKGIHLTSDETWVYGVQMGRQPEGYKIIAEGNLRRHTRLHAHVESRSRDCDGTYDKTWVDVPSTVERMNEYGDLEFQNRVVTSVISLFGHGTLTVASESCSWHEETEEGYRHVEITWCAEEDCDRTSTFRDHTAESMGY